MRTISEHRVDGTGKALGGSWRLGRVTGILVGILFLGLLHTPVQAGQSITLTWSPILDTNVAGCNLYYGVASRTYTNRVDTGKATSATIGNLVEGATYYFAVTAYNALGLESDYSSEVLYIVPAGLARLQIRAAPARQVVLTVTGAIGQTYAILATQDFKTWTTIGSATVGAAGSSDFTDTNAASFPRRFYRTR